MGSQQTCRVIWSCGCGLQLGCFFRDVPELGHLCQRVALSNYFCCPGLDVTRTCNPGQGSFHLVKGKNPGESQLWVTNKQYLKQLWERNLDLRGRIGVTYTTAYYIFLPGPLIPCIHIDNKLSFRNLKESGTLSGWLWMRIIKETA